MTLSRIFTELHRPSHSPPPPCDLTPPQMTLSRIFTELHRAHSVVDPSSLRNHDHEEHTRKFWVRQQDMGQVRRREGILHHSHGHSVIPRSNSTLLPLT